jgi:crossover junction endodeoxyribonuclease RusA
VSDGDWEAKNWIYFRGASGRFIESATQTGYEFYLEEVTSQSRIYKQKLRDLLKLEMKLTPQEGEFEVSIVIKLNQNLPPIDLDNVAKAVLDGLKANIFFDDDQVMRLEVEKQWWDEELVFVTVIKRA